MTEEKKGKKSAKGTSKLDFIPPEWQKDLLRLKMMGKTYKDLVKWLQREHGYSCSENTVELWLTKRTDFVKGRLMERPEYVKELESAYAEALNEFNELFRFTDEIVKSMWDDAKDGTIDDKRKVLDAVREQRTQIELANSLMGALPKTTKQAEDLAKSVNRALKSLQSSDLNKKKPGIPDKDGAPDQKELKVVIPGCKEPVIINKQVGIN